MVKYCYKKKGRNNLKKNLRILSMILIGTGLIATAYIFLPLALWYIHFQPVIEAQNFVNPIPKSEMIDLSIAKNLPDKKIADVSRYLISIPRLNIENAVVSTIDTDTTKHLVSYGKANIPGNAGNSLIFGHATLPQFFNSKNYKTIFANIYKLKNGDKIYATIGNSIYQYGVFKRIIIKPSDLSLLEQDYGSSYITLVTCTPPGTLWKRLIVKAKFERII